MSSVATIYTCVKIDILFTLFPTLPHLAILTPFALLTFSSLIGS